MWYAHMKEIDENRMAKKVFENELTVVRRANRQRKRWTYSVREILRCRTGTVEQAEEIMYGRNA